jgi:hypothetical protein
VHGDALDFGHDLGAEEDVKSRYLGVCV